MIIKRRKRERRKAEPYGGSGLSIVGMKVACEEKAMRGWKQPLTEKEESIDGKAPKGQAKGNVKGKDLKEEEI